MTINPSDVATGKRGGEALTAEQVRERLRKACEAEGGQAAWAKRYGVSPQYVNDVLSRHRLPGAMIASGLRIVENPRTWRLTKYADKRIQ